MNSRVATLSLSHRAARGPWARVLAGLWLALHVFTVAALPVADGFADHSGAVVAHVEDADGGNCALAHGHGCTLCQFAHGLSALASDGTTVATPAVSRLARPPHGAVAVVADLTFLDGNSSRAPPALG